MPKTILITGCSSGIGRHAAYTLAKRGWQVFASCRAEEDCAKLRDDGLESFRLDYTDAASIDEAVNQALERTGGQLDALFNNGAHGLSGAIEDTPTEAWRSLFETNFFGWHELTRRVLPIMRRQGHGRIVQCSSILGFVALRMRGAYNASKFAIEGYTDTLRLELAGTGIHAVLLEPGPISTEIRAKSRQHYLKWVEREQTPWAEFYRDTLEPRLFAEGTRKDRFELSPAATSAALVRALESHRPRARYRVTTPTRAAALLKRLLPTGALDRILLRG